MKITSISRKLLRRVLSFYFLLTFLVTGVQIGAEIVNTKNHINSELLTLEKTFSGSLTRAVWELNTQQAIDIAEGLVAIPMVQGIKVTDEHGQIITQLGEVANIDKLASTDLDSYLTDYLNSNFFSDGFFGHNFPLIFSFSGRTTEVGTVTLLSSNEVIFNRIEVGIYFLIGNAMVKTAALVILFSLAFSQLLTNPLNQLTEQINQFDLDDPESSSVQIVNYEQNELSILQSAYNNLITELTRYKEKLALAQNEVIATNDKLDEHNLMLEQEVARKTSSLSSTMLKMERQQRELLTQQGKLETENSRRSNTELTLTKTNHELKSSILKLNQIQTRLLDAEKMSMLGKLAAEISHEIDTPIGVGITATTYLSDALSKISEDISQHKLSKRGLDDFVTNAEQGLALLLNNLQRASELISSYKQLAVDQSSDKIRLIDIAAYIDEIIQSLHPKLKKTSHSIHVDCPEKIEIYSHAGALSQIFTHLILNSITHGFANKHRGKIMIRLVMQSEELHITFTDNGVGINDEKLGQLFDPYFAQQVDNQKTGLGIHIIHSLVTDTLNGRIEATKNNQGGLSYDIYFKNLS
jgi:C4-dicarboxylate-specific signal transduction histidine kinase